MTKTNNATILDQELNTDSKLPHSTNQSEGDSSPSTRLGGGSRVRSSPVSYSTKNDATIPLSQPTIKIAEGESNRQQCNTLQENFKQGANIEAWIQHTYKTFKETPSNIPKNASISYQEETYECEQTRIQVNNGEDENVLLGLILTHKKTSTGEHLLFIFWCGTINAEQAKADCDLRSPAKQRWENNKKFIINQIAAKIPQPSQTQASESLTIIIAGHSLGGALSQNTTLALTEKLAKEENPIKIASIQLMLVNSPGIMIENEKESFIENIQTLKKRKTTLSYTLLSTPGDVVEECYELLICHGQWDSEKIFIRPRKAASIIGTTCAAATTGLALASVAPVGFGLITFFSGISTVFGVSTISKVDAHTCESFLRTEGNLPAIRYGDILGENTLVDTGRWLYELGCWDDSITVYDSAINSAAYRSYLHHVINSGRASTLSLQGPSAQNAETNMPVAIPSVATSPMGTREFFQNIQLYNDYHTEEGYNHQEGNQQAAAAERVPNEEQPALSSCVIA